MKENNKLIMEFLEYVKIFLSLVKQSIILLQNFKQKIKLPFYSPMTKVQKIIFSIFSFFLSVYFTFVVYIGHSRLLFTGKLNTISVFITGVLLFFVIYNLFIFICYRFRNNGFHIDSKKLIRGKTFIIFFLLCWLPLLCLLIVKFPGLISPDTENQWKQVQTFMFNDWHPVIHTLLIWLLTRIVNHHGFVVFVQISVFSIGVGYLMATLETWGFSKRWLLISGLVIAINPYTINRMMYFQKDITFTILLTYTSIMLINIYLSDGAWFNKFFNIISFSIITALASMVRHNGIFFTVPLLILVLVFYLKRTIRVLIAVLSVPLVIFLVKVPLYSALNVKYPHNTYIESVGIPMTIMGDVLIKNPKALSPETKAFLYSIASDEQWRFSYKTGNYNTIKFRFPFSDVIKTIPVNEFFKMTLNTIKKSKLEAFHAFCDVTAIVWELNILPNLLGYIGGLFLVLLFAGIFALSRKKITALLLVVPPLMYNLGTMLLLCGSNDTRFFHFNAVITLPMVLTLLSKKEDGSGMDIINIPSYQKSGDCFRYVNSIE